MLIRSSWKCSCRKYCLDNLCQSFWCCAGVIVYNYSFCFLVIKAGPMESGPRTHASLSFMCSAFNKGSCDLITTETCTHKYTQTTQSQRSMSHSVLYSPLDSPLVCHLPAFASSPQIHWLCEVKEGDNPWRAVTFLYGATWPSVRHYCLCCMSQPREHGNYCVYHHRYRSTRGKVKLPQPGWGQGCWTDKSRAAASICCWGDKFCIKSLWLKLWKAEAAAAVTAPGLWMGTLEIRGSSSPLPLCQLSPPSAVTHFLHLSSPHLTSFSVLIPFVFSTST